MSTKEFITSDLHFGHKNIIKFCSETRSKFAIRPEHTKETKNGVQFTELGREFMNSMLIDEWNSHVGPNDIIYHVGDFSFMNIEQTLDILSKLNGVIRLIVGNHDNKLVNYLRSHNLLEKYNIEWIEDYHKTRVKIDDNTFREITMCHYPMNTWYAARYGGIHFYGHLHNKSTDISGSLNVGYDFHDKFLSLDEAVELAVASIDPNCHNH